ncbi:hypothetical protein [Thiothrix subterranea]|uniref:Uncharacterized protein n=1 Tax=Thiothrix subterranea TaxID=2735563 RepID=A0AA51MMB3_9GAMM|nr:hypothetical protein [Thiothrix subterranea]MDQ5768783.1 hypothetical protein [Thiothrix subterranea]WML86535.1 hypothetical protein RCG00_19905 [Thiothrix subterranea]
MKNRNIDMMTKPNFVINFSPILLTTLLVGAGCQMIDSTAVAENTPTITQHQTIPLTKSTTSPVPILLKPKPLAINNTLEPKKVTLETLASNSMEMAEQKANSNNSVVRVKRKKSEVVTDSAGSSNLSAITSTALKIAEDNANGQQANALQHQAALKRLVEQHFQQ